ncbi:MAG TPA: UDP-glucose/GDP-mannose dehydrogenase family protein [Rhizomicrobium sp.]|jgi:UDPglucose 6-dehydrogenase
MRIAMIGTGYVGLVSAACLSEFGHHVICVDKDGGKIADLDAGRIPIFEPGLEEVVAANVKARRLSFTSVLAGAVENAEAVFIAVGTPSRRGDGHADLSFVFSAAEEIARALRQDAVIVTKSTVPVGTSRKVEEIVRRNSPRARFDVASNPEFLREGSAIEDFLRPDRVVVGCDSEHARLVLREVYRPLYLNETPILFTSRETAELIKYAANAFLATKITFINEMADLCERLGGDVQDVARGIGLDGRIGSKFLHAGPGYGGSCFPKDTLALLRTSQEAGAPTRIVETVVGINESRKKEMARKISGGFGGVSGKTIAVLGLTFKPNTDDMRDAPSLVILPMLQAEGARIRAYDPEGAREAAKLLDVELCADAYEALADADGVVILTEWNEFRALDLVRVKALLRRPLMIDLRNIYRPQQMREAGFEYLSVGRPAFTETTAG